MVTALSVDDKAVVHYLHSVNSGDGTTARVPIALLTHHSYEPGLLPGPQALDAYDLGDVCTAAQYVTNATRFDGRACCCLRSGDRIRSGCCNRSGGGALWLVSQRPPKAKLCRQLFARSATLHVHAVAAHIR